MALAYCCNTVCILRRANIEVQDLGVGGLNVNMWSLESMRPCGGGVFGPSAVILVFWSSMQAKRSSYAPFLLTTIYDEQLGVR
jgi:hypothetical protein